MATYLDNIVAAHRSRASQDQRGLDELREAAVRTPQARDLAAALRAPGLSVIAEVKRRSPSKGDLAEELDPADVARQYAAGGAAAVSVLTDEEHFGGSVGDLQAARAAVGLPVLRKDFTVGLRDVLDARLMGADAVLLIAAVLDDLLLDSCLQEARAVGIFALVECHDGEEISRATDLGAEIIGVNQRDLRTFEVDSMRALEVVERVPSSCIAVAESGIRGPVDARELAEAGYDAVLVGESVVTSGDRQSAVKALAAIEVQPRGGARLL